MPRGSLPGERRGGRKKGTPNRKTAQLQEKVAQSGISPLDFLLRELGIVAKRLDDERAKETPDQDLIDRMVSQGRELAKDAAPYFHSRMAQKVELSGDKGGPIQMKDVGDIEVARRAVFLITAADRSISQETKL